MRDLSRFEPDAFDIVYHPHSLNFVPDADQVFAQVSRVLQPGGHYYFNCANPFTMGLLLLDWNGQGYPLHLPYIDGAEVHQQDESWVFRGDMPAEPIRPVKMFRHTLGTLVNGLIEQGFTITCLLEENLGQPDAKAEPGTSEHFTAVAPPWLAFWAIYHGPSVKGTTTVSRG
jgi:SAM-dependent methyltransferase